MDVLIKLLKQHTGVTAMIISCYLPSLSNTAMHKTSLTQQKRDITQCWFIVGSALQMMAQ